MIQANRSRNKFGHIHLVYLLIFGIVVSLVVLKAGDCLVHSDPVLKSDIMVPLMGSTPDRVLHTFDLYNQGISTQIVLVQPYRGNWAQLIERGLTPSYGSEQFKDILCELGVIKEEIQIVPGEATSTMQEALAIKHYININPGIDTITVISSKSNSLRAWVIFSKVLKNKDHPVLVSVSPSSYSNFDSNKWWANRENVATVFFEWSKLISFLLFEQWKL